MAMPRYVRFMQAVALVASSARNGCYSICYCPRGVDAGPDSPPAYFNGGQDQREGNCTAQEVDAGCNYSTSAPGGPLAPPDLAG